MYETSALATAEWAEYVAAFFNREQAMGEILVNIEKRFSCNKGKIEGLVALENRPKVVFANAYKSDYAGFACPGHWMCEIIEAAGGVPVNVGTPGQPSSTKFTKQEWADRYRRMQT